MKTIINISRKTAMKRILTGFDQAGGSVDIREEKIKACERGIDLVFELYRELVNRDDNADLTIDGVYRKYRSGIRIPDPID